MRRFILLLLFIPVFASAQQVENVIFVTLDGMRWQEVFQGADTSFFNQQKNLRVSNLKERFYRPTPQERREALFPFIWKEIARKGQIIGNRNLGSKMNVTNQMWFSYPGYNEMLTGSPDDKNISTNNKIYNPNQNVLEFLNQQKGFQGKIAAYSTWDVFPFIINDKRSGVYVNTGPALASGPQLTEREILLNEMVNSVPTPLGDLRLDAFTFYYGFEYLKKNKPRVLYLAFDETDDFAHAGEYGAYLHAANYTDRWLSEIWSWVESTPGYKGKTALVITVDHGRGRTTENWKHHGIKIDGADEIWVAMMGPGILPVGEVKTGQFYQYQIANTLVGLLGMEFKSAKDNTRIQVK